MGLGAVRHRAPPVDQDGRAAVAERSQVDRRKPLALGVAAFAGRGIGQRHERQFGQRLAQILRAGIFRSEEHTSEFKSLMRISYAVFCLKKKKIRYTLQELMLSIVMKIIS